MLLHVTLRGSDNRIVHCKSSFIRIYDSLLLAQQLIIFAESESDQAPETGDGAEKADDDQEEDHGDAAQGDDDNVLRQGHTQTCSLASLGNSGGVLENSDVLSFLFITRTILCYTSDIMLLSS